MISLAAALAAGSARGPAEPDLVTGVIDKTISGPCAFGTPNRTWTDLG